MALLTDTVPSVGVRVQRLLPFGMIVSLDDGSLGIIREREIAWDQQERRSWRQRFAVGDRLQAVPLGEGLDKRLELSLRLAQNDPWIGIERRYPLGALVVGVVTGIQPYGVFVELQPGVTGLLHVSRLPSWLVERDPEQIFWPGDQVRAIVERIDLKQRHIGLSLRRAWDVRWQHRAGSSVGLSSIGTEAESTAIATAEQGFEEGAMPAWTILVIEDDPAQLNAMTRWMQQAGHQVLAASTGEEAFALLDQHEPDLVLSDFGLPRLNGVALLRQVRELRPSLRCALMTDWAWASDQMNAIDELRAAGIQLLVKPLGPADITGLLLDDALLPDDGPLRPSGEAIYRAPAPDAPAPAQRQLRDLLRRLCAHTGASKAAIFSFDAAQRRVAVVAEGGVATLNYEAVIDLVHSPVRDVAEDRQSCRIDDAQMAESRVRYLKPLLPFRSCLGVRLPAQLADSYALFLFGPQPAAFDAVHEEHAAATALAAAALLERRSFQRHAEDLQRLALLGQLSRALVHEINHQLSPVNFVLSDIEHQLRTVEQRVAREPEAIEREVRELREIVSDLSRGLQSLTDTARMFGRVTMQTREQLVDLDGVLDDVVQLLRDMADRAHIELEVCLPSDLPAVRIHSLQLQQMILNITLNAIQHIALLRPAQGGRVVLRVDTVPFYQAELSTNGPSDQVGDTPPKVRIFIEDDGPGVHRQLWHKVFDLGFTTRAEGGSGLGLYITRSIANALDCRVFVEESCMLWGSTFVVELHSQAVVMQK